MVSTSCQAVSSSSITLIVATGNQPNQRPPRANLRRGKSLLARESDDADQQSGLNIFKRGATIRRKASRATPRAPNATQSNRAGSVHDENIGCLGNFAPGPKDAWMVYCYLLTWWVPAVVLRGVFGKSTPQAIRAWREKMGIVSIVAGLMAVVGFVTFGFTQTVCGTQKLRIRGGGANNGSIVVNGYDYDLGNWNHPAVANSAFNGSNSPIYSDDWMAGGKDASFLFQNVNKHCYGVITPATGTGITHDGNNMAWYFPCNLHDQNGTSPQNLTGYADGTNCHTGSNARALFAGYVPIAEIYYTWDMVKNEQRNLAVYKR
jgi:chitin synthase